MKKIKQILTVFMAFVMVITSGFTAYAKNDAYDEGRKQKYIGTMSFFELVSKSKDTYEIIENIDGKHCISKFKCKDNTYLVDEQFYENYNVISKYFVINGQEKIYLGQQNTIFEKESNLLKIKTFEDNKLVNKDKARTKLIGKTNRYEGYDGVIDD